MMCSDPEFVSSSSYQRHATSAFPLAHLSSSYSKPIAVANFVFARENFQEQQISAKWAMHTRYGNLPVWHSATRQETSNVPLELDGGPIFEKDSLTVPLA